MKKSNIFLVSAFAALMVIALFLFLRKNTGSIKPGEKDFAIKNTDIIDKIIISLDSTEISLIRETGTWRLNNTYIAKKEAIDLILSAFQRLDVIAPLPRNYQALAARKLENTGKFVEIYSNNRSLRAFYIDYDTSEVQGTIIINHKAKIPFLVKMKGVAQGNISKIFSTDLFFWRDNTLLSYRPEDIASVSIRYYNYGNKSFSIYYDSGNQPRVINEQTGEKLKNIDIKSANEYLYYFSGVKYRPVYEEIVKKPEDDYLFAEIKIDGKLQNSLNVRFFKKPVQSDDLKNENFDLNLCFAVINDEHEPVLIRYFDIDPILRDLGDFLKK